MAPKPEFPPSSASDTPSSAARSASIDPLYHILSVLPYSLLRPPRLRLKLPTLTLPSPMTVYALILLTYFMVVSGIVYDVIVEPPGIGSTQDPVTGSVRPVVFMPGRVNGQYIIEGILYLVHFPPFFWVTFSKMLQKMELCFGWHSDAISFIRGIEGK